jgi:H+/Cl- antiporter ClcA
MKMPSVKIVANKNASPTSLFLSSMGWGLSIGVLAAILTLLFMLLLNFGTRFIWNGYPKLLPEAGSWYIVIAMSIAGFLVGMVHHFKDVKFISFPEAIAEGHVDPRKVPPVVLVSIISLLGGFSLGPEAPSGMIASGMASWVSKRFKLPKSIESTNVLCAVSGAFGGLFTAPFAVAVLQFELSQEVIKNNKARIVLGSIAAVLGFVLFFVFYGDRFSGILRFLDYPQFDVKFWHFGLACGLGLAGTLFAFVFKFMNRILEKLFMPFQNYPVFRCTSVGFLIGVLGMLLPLTLFSGTDQLTKINEMGLTMGAGFILLIVFAKMFATASALSAGFIGGNIIPLTVIGGMVGAAVSLIFPELPAALVVGCIMASLPVAVIGFPLFFSIVVVLMIGIPATEAIVVVVASYTAYFVTHFHEFAINEE